MKPFLTILLALLAAAALFACREETNTPQKPTETEENPLPAETDLAFSARYIRTDGYHANVAYPQTALITSRAALEDYYRENSGLYDFSHKETVYSDTTIGFADAMQDYDDAWFDDHTLLLVLVEEGSGSIRHNVKSVSHDKDGTTVAVTRLVPGACTDDMAEWHLFIELDGRFLAADEDVHIVFSDETEPPPVAEAVADGSYAALRTLPDGWSAETTVDHNGNSAIRLYVTDKPDAGALFSYHQAFGVCGTGLRQETRLLNNGYEAHIGYYDGGDRWSFVTVRAPGSEEQGCFAAIIDGIADAWTKEECEQALDILGDAVIG